jgi:5-methylcytosine-specific restriction endonuclease McrBC regulatory subunit McrC
MMNTKELESILRWEENWFHEVSQHASPTRLVALRLVRHAIWYLRSRNRSADDLQAANLLLRCLVEMKKSSLVRAA